MSATSRVQLRHAGVDQHAPIGMVDDVHVDRHQLALDEQVGNVDGRDGDRGRRRSSFPETGEGRGLFHPRRELAFVDVVD